MGRSVFASAKDGFRLAGTARSTVGGSVNGGDTCMVEEGTGVAEGDGDGDVVTVEDD